MVPSVDEIKTALGSFAKILGLTLSGQISVEEAAKRACDPLILNTLPDDAIELNAELAEQAAFENWRGAIKGIRVIQAMLAAKPKESCSLALRTTVAAAKMEITTRACSDVPDGRIFRSATSEGDALVAETEAAGDNQLAGRLLQQLGILHLDPYLMGGFVSGYDQKVAMWKQRLHEEFGFQLAGIAEDELDLPTPTDAVKRSCDYFLRATHYRQGYDLALTLKALVQASLFSEHLGSSVDHEDLAKFVNQGLGLFSEEHDPALYADLKLFQAKFGGAPTGIGSDSHVESSDVDRLLSDDLQRTLHRLGVGGALQEFSAFIGLEANDRPDQALQLWIKVGPLKEAQESPNARIAHFKLGCELFLPVYGNQFVDLKDRNDLMNASNDIVSKLKLGEVPMYQAASNLMALAILAPNVDGEALGLQLLDAAQALAPKWSRQFGNLIQYLRAGMREGLGVNDYRAEKFADAMSNYILAARNFSDLRLSSVALQNLRNAQTLLEKGDDALANAVSSLASEITAIEAGNGRAGVEALRRLVSGILSTTVRSGCVNIELITTLWQVIKGASFSTSLLRRLTWRWEDDATAKKMLKEVYRTRADASAASVPSVRPQIDENELLSAFASSDEVSAGTDPSAIRENTEHAFDTLINARLLNEISTRQAMLAGSDQIRSSLSERTVLVSQLFGPTPDGNAALYTMIATREEITVTFGDSQLPSATVLLTTQDGKTVEGDYFTLVVGGVRKAVIENDLEKMQELKADRNTYLGGNLVKQLTALHESGKDHLCFSPHGSTQYYPFHLMGDLGSPLAEDWKITYMPSLVMLRPGPATATPPHTTKLRSFGVNWVEGNAAGVQVLTNADAEASTVAGHFGIQAELNALATKDALVEALSTSRMVHVATHGRHNGAAPALQTILMSATDRDDGSVSAYELIGHDFGACDLVTLSACETSLGRFDRMGNIRGLSAVLFMAGVRTIIGTLWEVESHCAQYFFSLLYERLSQGDSKLDAFSIAQTSAREYYPEYRDWGAFYYSGAV